MIDAQIRLQILVTILVMLASAFAEVVSIGAVIPFLDLISNQSSGEAKQIFELFGFNSNNNLPEVATFLFCSVTILASLIRILNLYLSAQLAAKIGSNLSVKLFRSTLNQPYIFHVNGNSSSLISRLVFDVNRIVTKIVFPLLQGFSALIAIIAISIGFLFVNWKIYALITISIFSCYMLLSKLNSRELRRIGSVQVTLNKLFTKHLQESFGSIRELILYNKQVSFTNKHSVVDLSIRKNAANANIISAYPKLAVEAIGIVLLSLIGYFFVYRGGQADALPSIAALAIALQRLLPYCQKLYEAFSQTTNGKRSLGEVLDMIYCDTHENKSCVRGFEYTNKEKLNFADQIQMKNLCFGYTPDSQILSNLNITIYKGECVGLLGPSGSGKSTIANLIVGLLKPDSGNVFVDGYDINKLSSKNEWYEKISTVPQSIYLTDHSYAENIAFDYEIKNIDMSRVVNSAIKAGIDSYIKSMPSSYSEIIGEQANKLSGGQRQRISIARALYKQPQLLVLDEATSALDPASESSIIEVIGNLKQLMTILIVTHNHQALKYCDRIFYVENQSVLEINESQLREIQDTH